MTLRTFARGFAGGGGSGEINPTDGVVPIRENGVLVDSPFEAVMTPEGNPSEIISTVPVNVGSGTLKLGFARNTDGSIIRGVTELKDSGESFLASDNITGVNSTIPITPIDDTPSLGGVGATKVITAPAFEWGNFGGTDTSSVTVSGEQKIIVSFTQIADAYATGQRIRGTQGLMHYRVIDTTTFDGIETLVYTSEQGDPIDFNATSAPDNQVEYMTVNPNFLRTAHNLRLEFFSADGNPMTMRGQIVGAIPPTGGADLVDVFIPYFETLFSFTQHQDVATADDIDSEYIDSDLTLLTSTKRLNLEVDCTAGAVNLTVPPAFNRTFTVEDVDSTFRSARPCNVDFTAYGQGTAVLNSRRDRFKFYYDGTQWRFKNLRSGIGGIV